MCIAAVKEKDIDAKLKQVIAEWSAHNLAFGNFKSRGELLLRGEDTNEVISLMEDSLMILSSLMSNRLVLLRVVVGNSEREIYNVNDHTHTCTHLYTHTHTNSHRP